MVVRGAVAALPEDVDARLLVVRHERGVQRRVVVGAAAADERQRVGYLGGVARRLLGDDVDGAGDGGRAEQRRASAAHHLYPLDHVGRDLLQAVHACQRAEYRAAIHQYLRVRAFQSVDAHLLEATVLAVVLHAHARLEVQPVGQRGGVRRLEYFRVEHVHQRGRQAAGRLVPVGGYHHAIERHGVLLGVEVNLQGLSLPQRHLAFDGLVADGFHHDGERSLG